MEFIHKNIDAVKVAEKITSTIKILTDAGFAGKEVEKVLGIIAEVEHIEWECDKVDMSFAKRLFENEDKLDPVSVMLWFNVIRAICKMSNAAESVGVQMRVMLARG